MSKIRAISATSRPARLVAGVVVLFGLLGSGACGPSAPTDTIGRDVFIDTYVDLRVAALDSDSQRVAASDREAILAEHGVTADDLAYFVQAHAADLDFMRDVWNDVELRLDRTPEPAGPS